MFKIFYKHDTLANRILIILIILFSAYHLISSYATVNNLSKIIHQNDTQGYLDYAYLIWDSDDVPFWQEELNIKRTPGYPIFISQILAMSNNNLGYIIISQSIALIISSVILFIILKKYVSVSLSLFGALLLLVDPISFIYTKIILTETLFTLFLCLSILIYIKLIDQVKNKWLLLLLFTLFITIYIRPIAIILGIFICTTLIISEIRRKTGIVNIITKIILIIIIFYFGINSWSLRNEKYSGCRTFSTVSKINLRDWMAAKAMAIGDNISVNEASQLISNGIGICEGDSVEYIEVILNYFPEYLELHIKGLVNVFIGFGLEKWIEWGDFDYQLPDLWQPYIDEGLQKVVIILFREIKYFPILGVFILVLIGYQSLFYVFVVNGIILILRSNNDQLIKMFWFLIWLIILLVNLPAPVGDPRFRVPVVPMFIMIIAFGISKKLKNKNLRNTSIDPDDSVG